MKLDKEAHVTSQIAGGFIAAEQGGRMAAEAESLLRQETVFRHALDEHGKVVAFVSEPARILGNDGTKHGEIAEQVEVHMRNARDILYQRPATATFEGVGRTAPEDYRIDGINVQSKFVNGENANLNHVLEHMEKYGNFGKDGSYYHIPKDHYEVIQRVRSGELVDGLSKRSVDRLMEKVAEIESQTGKSFDEVVKPGVSTYQEVQKGRIDDTLDRHKRDLSEENDELKQKIVEKHQPSLEGMAGAAATGAAVGAGIRLTVGLYEKHKQGRNVFKGELTADDWKELGVEAGEGAVQGGISAAAIYALTNYANMAAPFAGAFVSSALTVASLAEQYANGEIDFEQFTTLGLLACAEGAIVGLATAAGQALIPVPVLGSLVGAVAGRWLASLAKDHLGKESAALANRLKTQYEEGLASLSQAHSEFMERLLREYDRLGELTALAFDTQRNVALRLCASVDLARAYGVQERAILKTNQDLDDFMLA